jgi:tetratricopeptide (TPR) repeat protein
MHKFVDKPETALDLLERNFGMLREARSPLVLALYCFYFGVVYFDLGQLDIARSYTDEAIRVFEDSNTVVLRARAEISFGRIVGKSDPSRILEAEEQILSGIGVLAEMGIKPYVSQGRLALGELYADTGQKEKALEALKKADAEFKEMGMDYPLRRTQEVLARLEV